MSEKADELSGVEGHPFFFPSLSSNYPLIFQKWCWYWIWVKEVAQRWLVDPMSPLPANVTAIRPSSSLRTV